MTFKPHRYLWASLSSLLFLTGCNTESVAPAPANSGPEAIQSEGANPSFSRDMIDLKARETDPAALRAGIRTLFAKYGYSLPATADDALTSELPAETIAPLAKSAAGPVTDYVQIRSTRINNYPALYKDVAVGANQTLTVRANEVDVGADPVAVAFYKSADGPNSAAYNVKIAAWNDDYGGFISSFFAWTNNTGSTKSVRVLAFAYQPENVGMMNLSVKVTYQQNTYVSTSENKFVSATPVFEYNRSTDLYPSCSPATASRIQLSKQTSLTTGTGLLAFNPSTMNGGYIRQTSATLNLVEVLPAGYPRMFVGFWEADGFPDVRKTPPASLPYNYWIANQYNLMTCPTL
ncbi:MAG: hypothetical protein JWO30_4686 [Fibrobacteres bacterium]|nr:hypothetical protein [Fibrobacterota bacterium]